MAKDTKMYHIENDIDKIKLKTNLYINEYGSAGTFHLFREIFQNSLDECIDDDSNGSSIIVSFDKSSGMITVEDDGRGFPEQDVSLNTVCTTLQSGSKFFRNSGAVTAGEFGAGSSVVNALSDYFIITSYREDEETEHYIEYNEGVLVPGKDIIKKSKGKHGAIVQFRPSEKYMGKDCILNTDDAIEWIDSLFFLDCERLRKKKIKCRFDIYDGLSLEESVKFKPKDFYNLLEYCRPANAKKSDLSKVCYFSKDITFTEDSKTLIEKDGESTVEYVPTEKNIHMDIAFQYCTSVDVMDGATYDTYCNYTNTIENGTHLDAFEDSYCRFIQTAVNQSMSDNQKSKLQVKWDDIRGNLLAVISLTTNAYVGFVGNAKTRIDSSVLLPYMKELVSEGLTEYFTEYPEQLDAIVKIVKVNAKARQEAAKAKAATQTEKVNTLKEHQLSNFIRCNNKGKQWKEIDLVEGNSAAGSTRNGRDADTTAIFLLRGVTLNPIKATLSQVMANAEWNKLVTVLRCGIGPKFDMSKLYYNRINIFTDSDIDGLTFGSCKTLLIAGTSL